MKHFNSIRLHNPESILELFILGEMMLLFAGEGVGKLSMALNIAGIALHENTRVSYAVTHDNSDLIFKRFNIILGANSADYFLSSGGFKVINPTCKEKTFLDEIKSIETNALFIIDYLQAIEFQPPSINYETLLFSLKKLAKEKNLKILILSQKMIEDDTNNQVGNAKNLFRHFSQCLQLEHADGVYNNKRELSLIKSIHYQHHESTLTFDKKTFLFE